MEYKNVDNALHTYGFATVLKSEWHCFNVATVANWSCHWL